MDQEIDDHIVHCYRTQKKGYGLTAGKDRQLTSKADRAPPGSLFLPGLRAGVSRGESDEKTG